MKRMKKLIAALMVVAMIASLNISAFATTPDYAGTSTAATAAGDVSTNATNNGVVGSTSVGSSATSQSNLYSGERDKAQGSATGNVISEGKMPEGTVHMVMPTISASDASPFNMLLDPNDLIGQTSGEGSRIPALSEAHNSDYVYFTNVGDSVSYSSTSDALTVTNMGTWPLSVKLTAELSKGDTADQGSLIQMVDNKTKLASTNQTYKDIPAMYMAITPNVGTISNGTFTAGTAGTAAVVVDGYGIPSMAVTPAISTHGTSAGAGGVLATSPVFAFESGVLSREKKIVNAILGGNTAATARKLVIAATSPSALSATLYENNGTDAISKFDADGTTNTNGDYSITFTASSTATEKLTLSGTAINTKVVYKIKVLGGIFGSSGKDVATITFVADPVTISTYDGTVVPKSTITFTKSSAASSVTTAAVAVPAKEGAYELKYNGSAYEKVKTTEAAGADYSWNAVSFTLSAAINKSTAWNDLNDTYAPSANAITNLATKVIWDVANNYDADTAVNAPRVKMMKYAAKKGDVFSFKFDFGKGSNAAVAIQSITVGSSTVVPVFTAASTTANTKTGKYDVADPTGGRFVTGGTATAFAAANESIASGSTTGYVYSFGTPTSGEISNTSSAKLTYVKADGTPGEITFVYGAADA